MLRIHYHGGGDRNEKTVCNTRYQPRNCRGAEREREREGSAGKTGVTGPAREKPSKIKFFSFLAAKPFSPSFFPRLPATDSTFCTQNLMARGKDKDLSL